MPVLMLAVEGAEEFALVREFAIIMVVAGAVIVLFHKLKQPPILGYLLAGLIIGPFTLPNPPVKDVETIRLLADLGLVLLLFALGLEFGWRRIREVGLGVLFIGLMEITSMISLGYLLGRLLGWTAQESLFLGAAMSISSSAILVKVLRDSGQLRSAAGRVIVGILVVEDFAAVVLLTLLSGLAATGTAGAAEVGALVMKLALFSVAALAIGALVVPPVIRFVAQFSSRETMLLASLALCFSLALLGQTLEMSAAAGAFLIGAVVGDTDEAHEISGIIEPVRDMFGALFFVSIGMLIDVHVIKDHLIPALVVSVVFMVGKIVANTVGAFVSGQGERVPVRVGMGMPQIGEFSLAMMKIGVEQQAIGAFMYQVLAGVTAITSLAYPYVARSADAVADRLERRTPGFVRTPVSAVSDGLRAFRVGMAFDSEFAQRVKRAAIPIGINLLIIAVLLAVGAFTARYADGIADLLPLSRVMVGNAIGFGTLMLCAPSAVALWRELGSLADEIAEYLSSRSLRFRTWVPHVLQQIVRDFTLILAVLVIALWSLPLVTELLSLGSLAAPLPLAILGVLALVALATLAHMQRRLVNVFGRTFLGSESSLQLTERPGRRRDLGDGADGAPEEAKSKRALALKVGIYSAVVGLLAAGWGAGYVLTSGTVWWFL